MKRLLFPLLAILLVTTACILPEVTTEPPVIDSFDASPGSITTGQSSTLIWSVSDATLVSIDQEIGDVALSGTRVVIPSTTTTYTLTATNNADSVTATAQVVVTTETQLPTINSFLASSGTITSGESCSLSWSVSDATTVSIDQGIGDVDLTGSWDVFPTTTTTYTLTATNDADNVTATAQVVVTTEAQYTVTLYSIATEDGNVREGSPGLNPHDLIVGDDPNNQARQCFLSFDISEIPTGATIKSASLALSVGEKLGWPFANLGSLRVYNDQYGTLDSGDFTSGFPSGQMHTYHSLPNVPFTSSTLISKVQNRVNAGDSRFQVRLQFKDNTNYDSKIDAMRLAKPGLVITYED